MVARYVQGWTLDQIGHEFNITRQRVHQLMRRDGSDPALLKGGAAEARRERRIAVHAIAIRALLEEGHSVRRVADELGVSVKVVRTVDATTSEYAETRKLVGPKATFTKYTDDEVLDCLRAASEALGGVLGAADYDEFAMARSLVDGRPWPTHQTSGLRFGSWRSALEVAGLQANPSSPILGLVRFSDAECVDSVLEVKRAVGRWPTVREYVAYAEALDGLLPSVATLRHRFGSWPGTLSRASEFLRTNSLFGEIES